MVRANNAVLEVCLHRTAYFYVSKQGSVDHVWSSVYGFRRPVTNQILPSFDRHQNANRQLALPYLTLTRPALSCPIGRRC